MKLKMKLIINVILIFTFIFSCYYFSGYYLSVESCLKDTLKSLYRDNSEIISVFDNHVYAFDQNNLSINMMSVKKEGLFYRVSSIGNFKFDTNQENFDTWLSFKDNKIYVVAYRFNNQIDRIVINYHDDEVGVLDNWNDNLAYVYIEEIVPYEYTCFAYDNLNNLIEQTKLFGEE